LIFKQSGQHLYLFGQDPLTQEQQNKKMSTVMVGNLRFTSDMRQLGGLLLVNGLCAIVFPIANIVDLIEPDGATVTEGLAFASLFGSFCFMTIGFMSVFVGYTQLVHDSGSKVRSKKRAPTIVAVNR
jgi:membrane glycosyltransferase